MGITGLIPFLEKASCPINIRKLQGSSVAVDSYCWLHKGVFACAEKLIRGETTDVHIQYCLKYVEMLIRHKIKVIMVFDGRHLPAKAETERRRREARKESKRLAKEYLRMNEIEKARSHMRRAIDVTHEMALELIKECHNRSVDCIVAPYEADAQMAWLNKKGLAEYIITEDSDLTLFGAQKILFKLDLTGNALLVESNKLYMAMGCKPDKYTFDKFRRMCILSGCDYLDSLPGIGLKKACKFILTTKEDDMPKALKKIPSYLKMKQLEVTDDYIESFLKAEATFKHMFIYNPLERRMERLNDLEDFRTNEIYCTNAGCLLDDDAQAFQLAIGNLNPFTLKPLHNWHPNSNWSQSKTDSIWQTPGKIKENNEEKRQSLETSVFCFKKIEFKNMAELEIEEKLSEENQKLEESEIFSIYKYATPKVEHKRKRQSSSSSSDNEYVDSKRNSNLIKTSNQGSHNPFAKVNEALEKIQKSPVCNSNSLLKLLSPKKTNDEIKMLDKASVKSRFFCESVKQVVKKPFAVRDLTSKMFEIEEKTNAYTDQQKDFYNVSPPQTNDESKIYEGDSKVDLCAPNKIISLTENSTANSKLMRDEFILISDNEEKMLSQTSASSQTIVREKGASFSQTKSSLKRKLQIEARKESKSSVSGDAKQSRLSMFGFQRRPLLKKL